MTFVGKILVILIMAFSLVFLGVSTVVFTTATNWKTKAETAKSDLAKKTTLASDQENRRKDAETQLRNAQEEHQKLVTEKENRIKDLEKKTADADARSTEARGALEVAQKNAQVALGEATSLKAETDTLNDTLNKAQAQATQFNTQNLDLTDRIRILEREKATAEQNAKDLRDYKAKITAWAVSKGLSLNDVEQFETTTVAPKVDGRVTQIDARNKSMVISIGSNDGIASGQELFLYRLQPKTRYVGKVKILTTYPDKAVAEVINQTQNRMKILEGDIVSSSFDAR